MGAKDQNGVSRPNYTQDWHLSLVTWKSGLAPTRLLVKNPTGPLLPPVRQLGHCKLGIWGLGGSHDFLGGAWGV